MNSNIKPKSNAKEAPTEPFKRAVGVCRARIAGKPRSGSVVRRRASGLTARQGAAARAAAPAQRARSGDRARPRRFHRAPPRLPRSGGASQLAARGQQARARVRGRRAGEGGGDRLAAHGRASPKISPPCSTTSFHRGKFDEITDRADAPIEDALAMIVRERLTGVPPPPAARSSSSCGVR